MNMYAFSGDDSVDTNPDVIFYSIVECRKSCFMIARRSKILKGGSVVVEALCYKPEGRGIASR
jgi:hypothetical protein